MDLQEMGCEYIDWRAMAYDRVQWWGIVNVV